MALYQVVEGSHYEPVSDKLADLNKLPANERNRRFRKGATVESDRDLTVVFPNKFRKVEESQAGQMAATFTPTASQHRANNSVDGTDVTTSPAPTKLSGKGPGGREAAKQPPVEVEDVEVEDLGEEEGDEVKKNAPPAKKDPHKSDASKGGVPPAKQEPGKKVDGK